MTTGTVAVELSDPGILEAWNDGVSADPVRRPLILLERAGYGSADALSDWTVGRRDASLIELCARTFGDLAEGSIPCSTCGTPVEMSFSLRDLGGAHGDAGASFELVLEDGHRLRFRLPTSADLRRSRHARSVDDGARLLASDCLLEGDGDQLSDATVEALGAAMALNDPQADVSLEACCPSCGSALTLMFDIAEYAWKRVAMAGRQLIADVHQLASAYGWSEAEVLAIPAARRRWYLDLT